MERQAEQILHWRVLYRNNDLQNTQWAHEYSNKQNFDRGDGLRLQKSKYEVYYYRTIKLALKD